ncbi:MAG: helix-turn-helix domain-containing protein [bacterium]|nr:helix-turn-helix domain-containing protein [bacterium]
MAHPVEKANTRIIKVKDIMRLFFKYDMDHIPVIDKSKKLKGLLDKKLIIQDATDTTFIDRPFPRLVSKFIFYPEEEFFLQIVSGLPDDMKFPVIDSKGTLQHLWQKKDLLNSYYNITAKPQSETHKKEVDYWGIIDILPFNLLIVDDKNRILNANRNFLMEFDFEQDILFSQNINKFFPRITAPPGKNIFFPRFFPIKYRHINWFYTIFPAHGSCVYLFTLNSEILNRSHDPHDLNNPDFQDIPKKEPETRTKSGSLPDLIEDKESAIIKKALEENEWNISQTANTLHIPRQTLQYKISKYKIT